MSSRPRLFALTLLLSVGAVAGQSRPWDELLERFKVEARIERQIVLGTVRGLLQKKPARPDWSPRVHGEGALELGAGDTPILVLRGTPRAMGEQHGALMRDEIQGLVRYVHQFVGPRELPRARERAQELYGERLPQAFREELEGLAATSGVEVGELLLAQCFTDLYRGLGCTCVAAPLQAGTALARNLDFPGFGYLARYSLVVVRQPLGGRRTVSVSWPGLIGVLSGQSPDLALAVMVVHDSEGAAAGLPFQLVFRRVLEEAATLEQAHALLRELPRTVTNNLMVVEAAGRAAVFELGRAEVVRRDPPTHRWLVSTNHFVSAPLAEARASISFLNSRSRLKDARACRPEGRGYTRDDLQRALRESEVAVTQQSMLFVPATGEVFVSLPEKPRSAREALVRLDPAQLWDQD
ncbi:MAG: C45 family peptidase [Planctomycetota bacterium]